MALYHCTLENIKVVKIMGVFNRKTVRDYKKNSAISRNLVDRIIEAGHSAPSAMGCSPWSIKAVVNRLLIADLSTVHEYSKFARDAAVIFVVFKNTDPANNPLIETEEDKKYTDKFITESLSACVTCMLIEIADLALGGCWISLEEHDKVKLRSILKESYISDIPDLEPFAMIACGIPENGVTPDGRMY
jgi:nitroreductase